MPSLVGLGDWHERRNRRALNHRAGLVLSSEVGWSVGDRVRHGFVVASITRSLNLPSLIFTPSRCARPVIKRDEHLPRVERWLRGARLALDEARLTKVGDAYLERRAAPAAVNVEEFVVQRRRVYPRSRPQLTSPQRLMRAWKWVNCFRSSFW